MNLIIIIAGSIFVIPIGWVFIHDFLRNSTRLSPQTKHRYLRIHEDLKYNYFRQVLVDPTFTIKRCSFCSQKEKIPISKKHQQEDREFIAFLQNHDALEDYLIFMDNR